MNKRLKKMVQQELKRSRKKHPTNENRVLKVVEESNEIFHGCVKKKTPGHIEIEIVQTIAQCLRLWEEGDLQFNLKPFKRIKKK